MLATGAHAAGPGSPAPDPAPLGRTPAPSFLRRVLTILGPLFLHIDVRIVIQSHGKLCWRFDWNDTESVDPSGEEAGFIIYGLLHKPFYLLTYSTPRYVEYRLL